MNAPETNRQEIVDVEHLKLLSIVHYVYGALQVLLSCILLFHVGLGVVMTVAPQVFEDGPHRGPPAWLGLGISALAGCFMLIGWLSGGLTIYSGVCMKGRRHRTFSLGMAVFNCLSIPFGTVLGVFTIVVLSRISVKRLYDRPAMGPQAIP